MKVLGRIVVIIVMFIVIKACFFVSSQMAINSTLGSGQGAARLSEVRAQSATQTYAMPAEEPPLQHINDFSVEYEHPFLKNDRETNNMVRATNARTPGALQSVAIYTSKPSCGIAEARLVVATSAQEMTTSIDGAAHGSISQVSTLDGIVSPESYITPLTISGLPARKVSYRAKRWNGVIGVESVVVLDPIVNKLWHLQLIFTARNTTDYSVIDNPHSCAQKILGSIIIDVA